MKHPHELHDSPCHGHPRAAHEGHLHSASDTAFWDGMYSRRPPSNERPNGFLVQEAQNLKPGAALDVGCGEGADAIWLAQHGWQVMAIDLSGVALQRGRAADATRQVQWVQADLFEWQPPTEAFDLVTAHFLHIPQNRRRSFFSGLAQSVRPVGVLLVSAHHPSDLQTTLGRPPIADLYLTADEVMAALDPGRWQLLVHGTQTRLTRDGQGRELAILDTVLKIRRLGNLE